MAAVRGHQYFSLRWNNYQNTMTSVFQQLREDLSFVDVTLSCEHGSLKAHKVKYLKICIYTIVMKLIKLLFKNSRSSCPPVRHISKNYCSRIRANIPQLSFPPTLSSPTWKRSSILFIVVKSTSPNRNYRWVDILVVSFCRWFLNRFIIVRTI